MKPNKQTRAKAPVGMSEKCRKIKNRRTEEKLVNLSLNGNLRLKFQFPCSPRLSLPSNSVASEKLGMPEQSPMISQIKYFPFSKVFRTIERMKENI